MGVVAELGRFFLEMCGRMGWDGMGYLVRMEKSRVTGLKVDLYL